MSNGRNAFLLVLGLALAPMGSTGQAQSMGQGGWHLSQKTDPMSDARISRGARQYNLATNMVQAEIVCTGGRSLHYRFATYNTDGSVLNLNWNAIGPIVYTDITVRVNSDPAQTLRKELRKNTNVVHLTFSEPFEDNTYIPLAGRVVVKLDLADGEAVFEIDQTDPRIRSVIRQCVNPDLIQRKIRARARIEQAVAAKALAEFQQALAAKAAEVAAAKARQEEAIRYSFSNPTPFASIGSCVVGLNGMRQPLSRCKVESDTKDWRETKLFKLTLDGSYFHMKYEGNEWIGEYKGPSDTRRGVLVKGPDQNGFSCWKATATEICVNPYKLRERD